VGEQPADPHITNVCVCQTQREMEQFNVRGQQQKQQHHALLRDIDQQQRDTESQAHENEVLASAVSKILDQIKTGTLNLFLSFFLSRSLSWSLSFSLCVSLSLFLSVSLSLCVSLCLSLSFSFSLCVSLSLSFFSFY
jgi:hypothetical protein